MRAPPSRSPPPLLPPPPPPTTHTHARARAGWGCFIFTLPFTPPPNSAWQVYYTEKPFPLDRASFVPSRHGASALIFAGIFFNAILFSGIWIYKECKPEEDAEEDGFDDEEEEDYPPEVEEGEEPKKGR